MTSVFGYCKGDPSIPVDHLDYGYIEKCKDINKLQKILEILRSGEQGRYPALEQFTEKQLAKKDPDSPLLEKCNREKKMQELPKDDIVKTVDELKNLSNKQSVASSESENVNGHLPPIRTSKTVDNVKQVQQEVPNDNDGDKRPVVPKSPEHWEKISKQLDQDEGDFENVCKEKASKSQLNVDSSKPAHELLSQQKANVNTLHEDRNISAQNEKNKGNEAFRCGDHKEALIYYNRSLDILPTAASYNNRAITLIKLERFAEALSDCERVISLEPENIKAYMRRGIANQSLDYPEKAFEDFSKVVELEPRNKRGKDLLEKVSKELEKNNLSKQKKGTRMKIQEINSDLQDSGMNDKNMDPSIANNTDSIDSKTIDAQAGAATGSLKNKLPDKKGNFISIENSDNITNIINNIISTNKSSSNVNECVENRTENNSVDGCKNEDNVSCINNTNEEKIVAVNEKSHELPTNVIEMKDKGNHCYKTGQYEKACEIYTTCINTLTGDKGVYKEALATLFSNRSSCRMKMGNSKLCISDCDQAIKLLPSAKVYLKRAGAYESLEKYLDAYVDYQNVLKLDPSSLNALQAFSRIGNVLRSQYGDKWRDKLPKTDPVIINEKCSNTSEKNINTDKKEQAINRVADLPKAKDIVKDNSCIENAKPKSPVENNLNIHNQCDTVLEPCNVPTKEPKLTGVDKRDNLPTKEPQVTGVDKKDNLPTKEPKVTEIDNKDNGNLTTNHVKYPTTAKTSQNQDYSNVPSPNINKANQEKDHENVKTNQEKKGLLNNAKITKEKMDKEKRVLDFFETKERGNKCVQQEKYEEAAKYYTKCVELLPKEIPSYTNRALCYLKLKQPDKAIEDCTKALKLQPSCVKALFRRSQARKMTKEYKEALLDLSKVLKIEPNNNAAKKELEVCKTEYHAELRNIQAQNEAAKKKDPVGKSKKVPIEEVMSDSAEFSIKGKMSTKVGKCPLAKGNTTRHAPLKKMTGFEFLHAWNNVKSEKTSEYADLLNQIDPSKLPDLLSTKLDGEILKNLIRTVNEHFTTKDTYKQGIQLFKSLCRVSRFVTILMFLNTTEKTLLRCTIDLLETRVKQSSDKSLLSDVSSLRTSYRCS